MMYLVDTNIFLEVLLSRARREECKKLLSSLKKGEREGVVTDYSVHSVIVIMDRFEKLDELRTFLSSLTSYQCLYIYTTSLYTELSAINLSMEYGLDMDDAIQYSSALSVNADGLVSFDKHFDGLKIPRMEPRDLV